MASEKVQPMPILEPNVDEIRDINTDQILLDKENPRFAGRDDANTQEELIDILWKEMAVDEVAWSIAENGFFRSEPLFVIAENPDEPEQEKRKYIVIEGNRRLAAVRLLTNITLRKTINATGLPDLPPENIKKLEKLPVIIYPNRESLWTTVGFKHINGVKPWDSYSKAEYIVSVHEKYGISLDNIAQKIGDQHATVKRLYRGYKILEQAEKEAGFDKEDSARNRFYFSHLYTAVDQREYQNFLGIDGENSLKPNPIPKDKMAELSDLMLWLYGKKSQNISPKVIKQNPDLNTLRRVIGNPSALAALRKNFPLEQAHVIAIGDQTRFREALTAAKVELQNAKATVTTGYDGEIDLIDTINDILKLADSIKNEMDSKKKTK